MGAVNEAVRQEVHQRQEVIGQNPYSIKRRLELTETFQDYGYPDLAAGEAYIALLLVDEVSGLSGEFEHEALEAAEEDFRHAFSDGEDEHQKARDYVGSKVKNRIYEILCHNLIDVLNLKHAQEYLEKLETEHSTRLQELKIKIQDCPRTFPDEAPSTKETSELRAWGRVSREVYPFNEHEPDRSNQEALEEINELLQSTAPKLEARITELPDLTGHSRTGIVKQIGLFARENVAPGEEILSEKSILTATARLNDIYCDACAAQLPGINYADASSTSGPLSCEDCSETVFCSKNCHDRAQELYHPVLCDKDISSLAKDASAKEAADSLYALLLLRTLALAEHQDKHPLDLIQTKFLWGDFSPPGKDTMTLPFNLYYNVILPLTMLEKMEVNIFTSSARYNTWTFNTLYAKFRGTADARQGPDGKPEIGAVHPLWCLANHSCDPNVRWEWEGRMKFWVRKEEERVEWREGKVKSGLEKDEEVMGHYCDVRLNVVERRAWAKGALGGDCMCERCVWEAENPVKGRDHDHTI